MADIEIFKQLKNQLTENQMKKNTIVILSLELMLSLKKKKTISLKKRKFYLKDLKPIQRIFMKYVKLYMM